MNNILLIGMPGCGKSTVGVVLAKKLGFNFIDTDITLSQMCRRTLPEIIASEGFDGFIKLEGKAGESVECERTVIATGGSMVFSIGAMEHLKKISKTVWIEVGLEELKKRLPKDLSTRGIATPKVMTVEEIYDRRRPLYEKYADVRLRAGDSADATADAIIKQIFFR